MTEKMFDLPLEDFVLTFDDGLATQWKYFNKLKLIETTKIFFVSTNIICNEQTYQDTTYIKCDEAHEKSREGNFSNYMKWSQIEEIHKTEDCFIGGHSHDHKRHDGRLRENYLNLEADSDKMIEEFQKHEIHIDHFCYPYNENYALYEGILKRYYIRNFYGKDRIAIEEIM